MLFCNWGARGAGNTIWTLLREEWGAPRMMLVGRGETWVKMVFEEATEITRDRGLLETERAWRLVDTYCWVGEVCSSSTDRGLDWGVTLVLGEEVKKEWLLDDGVPSDLPV